MTQHDDSETKLLQAIDHITERLEQRCNHIESQLRQTVSATSAIPATPAANNSVDLYAQSLNKELAQELSYLEVIQPLLDDDSITDILINGHNSIYIERAGKLEKTNLQFGNDQAVMDIAEKIAEVIGRKVDRSRPLVDARLLDGSRVNVIAPPLAVDGTTISIRKFASRVFTLDKMADAQNVSPNLAEFLKVCGRCRLNVIVSGGTGAGKTTMLNAISRYIDENERIVTVEDAAELQLHQPHVVRLETKPPEPGMDASYEVTIRDLVRNALRMRPDRIIVGEVRGAEAFDMMQAMNTGHEGSLTTIHANHPRDALSRLENMIGMANLNIPIQSIRHQISSAINLIVQISRMRDGHRRITYVSEVVGMEGDTIVMQDLFNFDIKGEDRDGKLVGKFKWTNIMPRFLRRVAYYGEQDRLAAALGIKFPKL
jgi:pilus assembly protein CpaF